MANLQFVFLAVAVSLFFYTTNASEAQDFVKIKPNKVRSGGANFEYDDKSTNGPKSWGKIDPEFEMCGLGQHQSPINLIIKNSTTEGMMPEVELFESVLQYRPSGNNYVLNCRGGPGTKYCTTVTYYKERYHMLQAHFHSPSEHLIDGKSYPLEMHIVHQREDEKAVLVLGILFNQGRANEEFEKLLNAADEQEDRVVDFSKFLNKSSGLCTYEGSLTTPPCTEGVHWLLSDHHPSISLEQIGKYRSQLNESTNNRPVQPIVADPQARCFLNPKISTSSDSTDDEHESAHGKPSSGTGGHDSKHSNVDSGEQKHGTTNGTETNNSSHGNSSTDKKSSSSGNNSENHNEKSKSKDHSKNQNEPEEILPSRINPKMSSAGSSSAECFPSSAKVTLVDGRTITMAELQIGDEVAVGGGKFSPVYAFSHRDGHAISRHVRITLDSGNQLTLTPGHFIQVNDKFVPASQVSVGDYLTSVNGNRETVKHSSMIVSEGLYNPHTVSGTVIVNDILCSTYTTAVESGIAQALLSPFRFMFQFGMMSEKTGGQFLMKGDRYSLLTHH